MTERLIRYRTRPAQADHNPRLIESVFAKLHTRRPPA